MDCEKRKRSYRAMTLIEALVASVLLGVGVVGLMSAGTLAVRNQRRFEYRTGAMCLAQEKLAEVEVVGAHIWTLGHPTTGSLERQGVVYDWEIRIESQAVGELLSVVVEVNWQAGMRSGTVEVETWLNDYEGAMLETPERPAADGSR